MAAFAIMVRGEARGFDLKRQLRLSASPFFASLLAIYFGYHLIEGNRGLLAYFQRDAEVTAAKVRLNALVAQLRECELRVNGLKPESLDLDLLEERARILLNMGAPGDLILLGDQAPGVPPGCFGPSGAAQSKP